MVGEEETIVTRDARVHICTSAAVTSIDTTYPMYLNSVVVSVVGTTFMVPFVSCGLVSMAVNVSR